MDLTLFDFEHRTGGNGYFILSNFDCGLFTLVVEFEGQTRYVVGQNQRSETLIMYISVVEGFSSPSGYVDT